MSQVRFPLAFILGIFLQTFLLGLLVPLLIIASYAQWKKVSRGREINLVMAFATVFFGLSNIAHWILGMRKVVLAALYLPPGMTIDQYFLPPYSADEIVRRAIFQSQVVVGDIIMVYRMYHIYGRSLPACVIPSITTAGLLAISCGLVNQLRNLSTPAEVKASNNWSMACFCVTLFNSVFMSGAISLRLWGAQREISASDVVMKDSVIMRATRVLVESVALWTLFVTIDFAVFIAKSNIRYTFLDMASPVLGISFYLIIVRLGFMTPEVRERGWQSSQRSRTSGTMPVFAPRFSGVSVSLDRAKGDQDVSVSESENAMTELYVIGPTPPHEK